MQARSEETRTRILEAALRRFAVHGYNAASIDQICADAGVSKGAFYHHFSSKQAIFLTLIESWLGAIDAGLNAAHHGSVPETFIEMAENTLPAIFATADDRLPMFLEFWLRASRDESVWKTTIEPYHRYQAFFANLIQQGIDEGSFAETDTRVAGNMIVSLSVGLLLQGLLDPNGANWSEIGTESMKILIRGLSKA